MSRFLVLIVILVVVVTAALFLLAGRMSERPVTRVEKPVSLANLQG